MADTVTINGSMFAATAAKGRGAIDMLRNLREYLRKNPDNLNTAQTVFLNNSNSPENSPTAMARRLGWLNMPPVILEGDTLTYDETGIILKQGGTETRREYSEFVVMPQVRQSQQKLEPDEFVRGPVAIKTEPKPCKENFVLLIDLGHGSNKKVNGLTVFDHGVTVDQEGNPIHKLEDIVPGVSVTEEQLVEDFVKTVLKPKLEKLGYVVLLSRDGNIEEVEDIDERVTRLNGVITESNVDAVISIHANSSNESAAQGFETYYYDADDKLLSDTIAETVQDEKSKVTGLKIHDGRGGTGSKPDIKSPRKSLAMCRSLLCPSSLTELAFLTNIDDLKLLRDPKRMDSYADILALALRNYQKRVEPNFKAVSFLN